MKHNKMPIVERLYLSGENGEINREVYVDNCHLLQQHQKDGIRFLYMQFKEPKPGVILNDPSGYGKRLQIVLFIKAIILLLKKPVIIFCKETEVQNWVNHFEKWTNLSEEVVTEARNHSLKKLVFINTLETWNTVSRGNWSVMVIDNDYIKPKSIEKTKAHFKIWVSSKDVKENRVKFGEIYKWLYNCDKDLVEFENINKNTKNAITKAIQLQSFLERVVLRRSTWNGPFFNENTNEIQRKKSDTKDVTGTKIKRTRKTTTDIAKLPAKIARNTENADVTMNDDDFKKENESDVTYKSKGDGTNDQIKKECAMDVENFIRDKNPINSDGFNDLGLAFVQGKRKRITNAHSNIKGVNKVGVEENEEYVIKDKNDMDNAVINEIDMDDVVKDEIGVDDVAEDDFDVNNGVMNEIDVHKVVKDKIDVDNTIIKDEMEVGIPTQDSLCISSMQVDCGLIAQNSTGNRKDDIVTDIKIEQNPRKISKIEEKNSKHCEKVSIMDSKVSDLEKQAIKKFKGSILDRLF